MIYWLRSWWARRRFVIPEPLTHTFCDHAYDEHGYCWFCGESR